MKLTWRNKLRLLFGGKLLVRHDKPVDVVRVATRTITGCSIGEYDRQDVNIDMETGIRYGVIPVRLIHPEEADRLFYGRGSRDRRVVAERRLRVEREVLRMASLMNSGKVFGGIPKEFSEDEELADAWSKAVETLSYMGTVSQAAVKFRQHLEYSVWPDEENMDIDFENDFEFREYKDDNYILSVGLHAETVWVIKSPFFTYCKLCSDCAPNAGDLTAYDDDGLRTYALPACHHNDWMESGYKIWQRSSGIMIHTF